MPTFDTPQPITATVEIAAGAVRLVATERTDTVVEVRPRDESRPHDVKAAEQVRVDFSNGTLAVLEQPRLLVPAPRSRRRRRRAAVRLAAAGLRRLGAASPPTASTPTASWRRRAATWPLESARGKVKADTASGDVTVALAMDSASVSTASGDVTLGELRGEAKFRAASGSLRVGRLEGSLNAQTASGDVTVAAAVKGDISVQTSSGEVGVGIAEGTAAQLDLRTRSGSVRNSLQPSDGPADGDETLVVHARTGSGDVVVQRATGPAAA